MCAVVAVGQTVAAGANDQQPRPRAHRRRGYARIAATCRALLAVLASAKENAAMPDVTPPRDESEAVRPGVSPARSRRSGGAVAVAAGIFLSRIAGLVRDRLFAHYLGLSNAQDVFRAALRIPNYLQNLLGEGVLSASFIPVYARLLAEHREADATRVARAVGTLLVLLASLLTLAGVLAADLLVSVIVPGWHGEKRELTVTLVRILFPGVALLVMSAWCLGVLNSHRKFFLSYASPVLWNAALIATTIVAGRRLAGHDDDIAVWLAWGAVIGSAAQFLVQLPTVILLLRDLRPSLAVRDEGVQKTLRAFVPIFLGRGSVQISAFIDSMLASYLGKGIIGAMSNAQTLYTLPVSLFGMAVSAAELPEMSSATGDEAARHEHLQTRLRSALRRVVFLVVPSAIAFIAIGGPIVALIFQGGRFTASDTTIVWIILAGSAIGLSGGTQGRLLGSAFYALGDPKPPLHAALVRVAITGVLGYAFALPIRNWLGSDVAVDVGPLHLVGRVGGYSPTWGAFALTASAGFAAWVEFLLLDRWLSRRIGKVPIPVRLGFGALAASVVAGAAGFGGAQLADHLGAKHWVAALVAIPVFGVVYLGIMVAARVPEISAITRRFFRR
ncbi:MAG TPA: murein biosynthesis integral membrane protein MurJ [Kofleriaceae bacterium]|nr:murein biosynthesis integral membrane protein MurJ [Kofleriaceae bacterium]